MRDITIVKAEKADIPMLQDMHDRAFAACSASDELEEVPMPDKDDIEKSMNNSSAIVYKFMLEGECIGGASVIVDDSAKHNDLELLFIDPAHHGKGNGTKAWEFIEKEFPETKVWELVTPYFEKRNIHFYVNKCGFHIVEYFCEYHKDTYLLDINDESDMFFYKLGGMFRFEKRK